MAVTSSVLCTCFLILLPAVAAESGSEAPIDCESCADDEPDSAFTCFTRLADRVIDSLTLVCHLSGMERYPNDYPGGFIVCPENNCRACSEESQLEHHCSVEDSFIYGSVKVCLMLRGLKNCQDLSVAKIIKPEAPFGLNVTYQENEDAYLVHFSIPPSSQTYLKKCLMYEIAYWPEDTSGTTTSNTKVFQHVPTTLLRKEFQPGTRYEAKIRSKPIGGGFFDGSWSEWSPSAHFQTAPRMPDATSNNIILITALSLGFLVLLILISLIPVFWKNRIKPLVWPAIPNHEKALDKLCNKLIKNSEISVFDPESFGYAHIHKVDSIHAKSEISFSLSLLPWATDIPEKVGIGLDPKNSLSHINHGWLKLSRAYEGMWPAERLNGHLGRSHPIDHDAFTDASLSNESSAGGQQGCSDAPGTHSSGLLVPFILPGLGSCQADPHPQTYANSEMRVSNKEEAYVTMANFSDSKGNLGN